VEVVVVVASIVLDVVLVLVIHY